MGSPAVRQGAIVQDNLFSRLYRRNAVLHSLVWLAAYLVLNTVTDNIAGAMHADFNTVSAIPNLLLAGTCFAYLRRTGIGKEIGLLTRPTESAPVMLYYLPLLALPFVNLAYGLDLSLSAADVLVLLAMYCGVGFMEEVIFRGLMFKALSGRWNPYVVVAFISLTFAVGHIVSMVAIAQSGGDTVLQIVNSLFVGFLFMAVMLASGNLTVCIVAHILYNFLASVSLVDSTRTEMIAIGAVVTSLYFGYLLVRARRVKEYFAA